MEFLKLVDLPPIPEELLLLTHVRTRAVPDIGYGLDHYKDGVKLEGAQYSRNKLLHPPLINWIFNNIPGIDKPSDISLAITEHPTGGYHVIHSDFLRHFHLNYFLDLGGENVVTSFWQEKDKPLHRYKDAGWKQSDSGQVKYDDCTVLQSVICEKHKWYSLTSDVLHDVGPIVGKRTFITVTIKNPEKFKNNIFSPHYTKNLTFNLGNMIDPDMHKVAVYETETKQKYMYKDIDKLANRVANTLSSLGVQPGDKVIISGFNSVKFITAYFGVLRYGAVAVLVNPNLPQATKDYILADSKAKLVFDLDAELSNNDIFDCVQPSNTDIALMLYTSGSTGMPKGVLISHKNHSWIVQYKSSNPALSVARTLIAAPFYHMNGLSNMESTLTAGGTIILMPKYDAVKFVEAIEFCKVNLITSVPSMLAMAIEELKVRPRDMSSVYNINMASAPVTQNLFDNVKEYFPTAEVRIGYGLTEVGPGIFGRHPMLPTPAMSVGYPLTGVDYRLIDGVLQIRSPSMLTGYSNTSNDKITSDGYFNTNDLFRVDENGFYYFLGRADDMFVSGGNNIYPRNVESILETHPAVMSAAVIGITDDIKGMKPYAFVTTNQPATEEELKNFILDKVAPFELPRQIWFLETMPVTDINKIDKKKLLDQACALLNIPQ